MIDTAAILQASILIVDDEEPNVLLLERILRGAKYTDVTSTTNPRKVCELYRAHHYDLILLDIKMAGLDGFQVMAALKQLAPDDYPAVLVITAEPGHKARALEAGAKDFVSKPYELVEVLTRVHNMIEAHLLQREILDHQDDNPALPDVIQRNIRQIIKVRLRTVHDQSFQDQIASRMTAFSGSMTFFHLHTLWFGIWILLNTGRLGLHPFDPFPYGLLTMIVSLEAIFLSTCVLISQNVIGKEAERLTDLGLHTSLLTEHELTRVLQMLHAIQSNLGISNNQDSILADADLEMETKPEDVLAEIERLHLREARGRHHGHGAKPGG